MGSSFIRRIKEEIQKKETPDYQDNFGFPSDYIYTSFTCLGGWKVRDVPSVFPYILKERPQAVVLQIGSNDLAENYSIDADVVASSVLRLAAGMMLETGVSLVCVCPCFQRKRGKYLKKDEEVHKYNTRARQFNNFLYRHTAVTPGLHFWPHKGLNDNKLWYDRHTLLKNDGVHLTEKGQLLLYKSLAGAVLFASGQLMCESTTEEMEQDIQVGVPMQHQAFTTTGVPTMLPHSSSAQLVKDNPCFKKQKQFLDEGHSPSCHHTSQDPCTTTHAVHSNHFLPTYSDQQMSPSESHQRRLPAVHAPPTASGHYHHGFFAPTNFL